MNMDQVIVKTEGAAINKQDRTVTICLSEEDFNALLKYGLKVSGQNITLSNLPATVDPSVESVIANANANMHKRPNMRTLMEEVAEAILADRGKHDDPLALELTQIAGICINMLRQIEAGYEVGLKAGLGQSR